MSSRSRTVLGTSRVRMAPQRCCTRRAAPPQERRSRYPLAGGSRHLFQLALEVVDLVPQSGGVLETQLTGRVVHLLFESLDEPRELVLRHAGDVARGTLLAPGLVGRRGFRGEARRLQDVGELLADRGRVDAVTLAVGLL